MSSLTSVPPVSSRLPCRFEFEESTVHTAELSAMIASLRWCTPGLWNMFVGDRSSLFAALREAADPAALWPSMGACVPLEGRLRAILRRIANSWSGDSSTPLWRDDQELHPEKWDVRIPLEAEGKPKWMSKISFNRFGLVGVDVKSHQVNTAFPYPVITQGNEAQDMYCSSVSTRTKPKDILLPSGGPFAFLCKEGRMVTTIPNKFAGDLLRRQSTALMSTKLTQGMLAKFKGLLYPHTLDIRIFAYCSIPPHLHNLVLSSDKVDTVDLSCCMFRMHRAVGGSWTEYLKTDKVLRHLADARSTAAGLPSIRTCPFCRVNHVTPRHYVMECPETKQQLRTLLVSALSHRIRLPSCVSPSGLFSRHGGGWRESLPERSPFGRLRLALSYLNLSPPWTWPIGVYFLLRSVMPSTKWKSLM